MSLDLIALVVFVLSLIGILVIIGRKFPTLAAVDPNATKGPHEERKSSIIEQRLRRKVTTAWSTLGRLAAPVTARTGRVLERAHDKLVELEHEYKIRSLPVFLSRRQRRKIDNEIATMLTQAQAFVDDKEYAAAEEKTMQAIRLEPRSVPAFELLGQLYVTTKEYGHAKEVYQYLLKLTGDSDAIYDHQDGAATEVDHLDAAGAKADTDAEPQRNIAVYHLQLAQAQLALDEPAAAFESMQEAIRLEPNNPKILDAYVEASIAAGKRQFAEDAVARIEMVNPENSKIVDWRERIAAIETRHVVGPDSDDQMPSATA